MTGDSQPQSDMERFLAVLRRNLKYLDGDSALDLDAELTGLGLDSASALSVMLDLEEEFGIFFESSMFTEDTFATPRKLWESLSSLRH